jgi:hypothetical protein
MEQTSVSPNLKHDWDAYDVWNDCEEGDVIAIYELKLVTRVKDHVTKQLVGTYAGEESVIREWSEKDKEVPLKK